MTIHQKHVKKYKFLQWLLICRGHILLSIWMCHSTWFMKRKLAREKEILELPEPKHGKCFWKEIKDSVKLFCEDDEYWQFMPGAKDYVSTAWNFHQQKHLLLCNVKEFYQSYNEKFFQNKIGLNSDLSGTLQSSHLVLILYVCALSIKT